jgi:hypothetical protein
MRWLLAGLAALSLGCNPSQERSTASEQRDTVEDSAAGLAGIDSLLARFAAAHARRDAAGMSATYTDSSFGIGEGQVWDSTGTTNEASWKQELPHLSDMKLNPVRRSARGDVGVVLIQATQQVTPPKGKGEAFIDSAWVLSEVRKGSDGQWRWHTWMISRTPRK